MAGGLTLKLCAGFVCLSLLYSSPVFSGRPLVIDDARPVAEGNLGFELGIAQRQPEKGGRDQQWPVMTATYGLYKGLEVGVGIQRTNTDVKGDPPVEGFQDLHLATKYNFLPGEFYDFSFAFDLKVPTANRHRELTSGRFDESFVLIATKHFFPAAVDLNLGYTVVGRRAGEKLENRFLSGMALRYGLNERWRLVGDIYVLSRSVKGEKNEANFQVGFASGPTCQCFSTPRSEGACSHQGRESRGPWDSPGRAR